VPFSLRSLKGITFKVVIDPEHNPARAGFEARAKAEQTAHRIASLEATVQELERRFRQLEVTPMPAAQHAPSESWRYVLLRDLAGEPYGFTQAQLEWLFACNVGEFANVCCHWTGEGGPVVVDRRSMALWLESVGGVGAVRGLLPRQPMEAEDRPPITTASALRSGRATPPCPRSRTWTTTSTPGSRHPSRSESSSRC